MYRTPVYNCLKFLSLMYSIFSFKSNIDEFSGLESLSVIDKPPKFCYGPIVHNKNIGSSSLTPAYPRDLQATNAKPKQFPLNLKLPIFLRKVHRSKNSKYNVKIFRITQTTEESQFETNINI